MIQYLKIVKNLNLVSWLKPNKQYPSVAQAEPAGGIRRENHQRMPEMTKCILRDTFFSIRFLEIWNQLPNKAVEAVSVNDLKNKLDKFLESHFKTNEQCKHLMRKLNPKALIN